MNTPKLIANAVNMTFLRDCLPPPESEVEHVLAAIAYADREHVLIDDCARRRCRLDLWLRYDEHVPVPSAMLKRLLGLHSRNFFTTVIPDVFHAKVIWWKGHGAYIGSANLTDRAWMTNIECGVFFPEEGLRMQSLDWQLDGFFDWLRDCPAARQLDKELVNEVERLERRHLENNRFIRELEGIRKVPYYEGPMFEKQESPADRHLRKFEAEWRNGITTLRSIADQVDQFRPLWIGADVPLTWQADQFLHAYYYNRVVGENRSHPYGEFHETNKADPGHALAEALRWWQALPEPPTSEDEVLTVTAPRIQTLLAHDRIAELTADEFVDVCRYTHAIKDHVIKIPLPDLGLQGDYMSREERLPAYAHWLWRQRSPAGNSIRDMLTYALYGGPDDDICKRLYEATWGVKYRLPHFGLNSLAEIIGWAAPGRFSPRNGRTSKALRALGYPVHVYS